MLDGSSNIISCNKQFEEVLGPLSTLKGINFVTALIMEDQKAEVLAEVARQVNGQLSESASLMDVDTLTLSQGMPINRRFNWTIAPFGEGCVAVYGEHG